MGAKSENLNVAFCLENKAVKFFAFVNQASWIKLAQNKKRVHNINRQVKLGICFRFWQSQNSSEKRY
jgi:hypothetical protein